MRLEFLESLLQPLGQPFGVRYPVRERILCLHETGRLHQFGVIGRIVRHQQARRPVEPFDQYSRRSQLFVGRKIEWTAQDIETSVLREVGGRLQQRARGLGIMVTFEQTKEADRLLVKVNVAAIYDRSDSPYRLRPPPCQEALHLCVTVEGM